MKKTKQNIESLQEFAENKSGKLISTEYINSDTKMLWECLEGHQWEPPRDLQKDISSFLPPSDSKRFLRELVSQSLSNKDCEKVIGMLVEYLSKEDRNIKLDENIETSILSFYIDKA